MPPLPPIPNAQRRLAALRRYGILDSPVERDFDDLCRLAAQICRAPIATVTFIDADRQWFKSEIGLGVRETPLDNSICRHAIVEEETLVVPDTLEDPRFSANPLCTGEPHLRFYAGANIRTPDGFVLGTLCVLAHEPRQIAPAEIEALRTLARQVMALLELRRQKEELARIAAMRGDISVQLASGSPLREILQGCAESLVHRLDAAFARVWTLDDAGGELLLQASAGIYTHLDGPHGRVKVGEFKIGRIAHSRQALLTNDVENDPNISDPAWARREGMTAFAGYPLIVRDRVVGVLAIFSRNELSATVLADLTPIADGLAQCIFRKCAEDELRRSEEMARFLAQVSADLAELTDDRSALQKIASSCVPAFADWCAVDLLDENGRLKRLAVTHIDQEKARSVLEIIERYPPLADSDRGIAAVVRKGVPEMVGEMPDSQLQAVAQDAEHLQLLRELNLKSYVCVPLTRRGKAIGALTFVTSDSGRHYNALDLVIATDLAHRAGVAMENADLYRELQEGDRRKDEFLATLAHELRNPLAPLRNALALLKHADCDSETLPQMRDIMDRQVQQMVRLVDDLLDVSRITRGRIELRREPLRLAEAVESAAEISRPMIHDAEQSLAVRLPEEPCALHADPTRLAQIFSNLLNNASKYTDRGGSIWLTAETDGAEIVVRVRDNGVGIRPEMLPRIFDLFTQEDRSLERAQGGLGIGLTLVKKLIEMHGGTIGATSEGLGQGSEFTVRLPVFIAAAVEPAPSAGAASPVGAPGRHRILVVDDNRDGAVTLSKLLRRRGHEVELAFDGEEAVLTAASFRPTVVLLDIGLPKLNGYEAARRILAERGVEKILLIALTGWGQEDDRRRARDAGFTHHLVKPIDFEELLGLL